MNIVLHEPEIPFNTGAIGRTCVATKSTLHLIKPYGFILNDKNIKKAGMDYWSLLKLREYISYEEFIKGVEEEKREMEKVMGELPLKISPLKMLPAQKLPFPRFGMPPPRPIKPIQRSPFLPMITLFSERNPPVFRRRF